MKIYNGVEHCSEFVEQTRCMQILRTFIFADCSEIAAYKLVGSSSFFPFFVVSISGSALSLSRYFIKLIVGVFRDTVVGKIYVCNARIHNICTFRRYCNKNSENKRTRIQSRIRIHTCTAVFYILYFI